MTHSLQNNDISPDDAYKEIVRLAEQHGLILQAFGGVITIVHQDTQKREGLYEKCQYMAGLGPAPKQD